MKKRFLSMILATTMCAALLPTTALAASTTLKSGSSHSETITFTEGGRYGAEHGGTDATVTIKLTYDGYLGEVGATDWVTSSSSKLFSNETMESYGIDATFDWSKAIILEEGSNITVSISSSDSNVYYNAFMEADPKNANFNESHAYNLMSSVGSAYTFYKDEKTAVDYLTGEPVWAYFGNNKGELLGSPLGTVGARVYAEKVNTTTYSYNVYEGMYSYTFDSTNEYNYDDFVTPYDSFYIGNYIGVSQDFIDGLVKDGVYDPFFANSAEYGYEYTGLLSALNFEEVEAEAELPYTFELDYEAYTSSGEAWTYTHAAALKITFKNTTSTPQEVNAGLLMKLDGLEDYELHYFSCTLSGNGSKTISFESQFSAERLVEYCDSGKLILIDFDDAAELESIQNSMPSDEKYEYLIESSKATSWLASTLGYIA